MEVGRLEVVDASVRGLSHTLPLGLSAAAARVVGLCVCVCVRVGRFWTSDGAGGGVTSPLFLHRRGKSSSLPTARRREKGLFVKASAGGNVVQ